MIKKSWNNEFLRGGFFLTCATFLGNILNYCFNLLIARSLGPSGLGEIASLFSYISIISLPMTVVTTLIIQKISVANHIAYTVTQSLEYFFWSKIRKWWFFGVPLLLLVPFIPQLTRLQTITSYSIPILIMTSLISSFYNASFQGLKLFVLVAVFGIIGVLFKLIGALLVFFGVDGLVTVIFFLIISAIFGLFVPMLALRRIFKKKLLHIHTPTPIHKRFIDIILNPFFLTTTASIIALTVFNNIDIVIVKRNFTGYDAGIYSSWALFSKVILFAFGPITSVSFVFFANDQKKLHHKTLNFSLWLLLTVGIITYVIYRFFGALVIALFFGDKFTAVIPYLSLASIFGTLYTAILFINMFFLARKSVGALILPLTLPFYILIISFQKQLSTIMNIDIIFSFVVAVVYLLFYVYNNWRWNKNKQHTF